MTRFEIASPLWLLLLFALVPVLLLRIRAHLLARRGAPGLVSPRLRDQLVTGSSVVWRWLRFSLFALAFAAVTVALSRPRWGVEKVETQSHGRNILVAIDTSRSMLANDVSPNRLDRAKLAAEDIVRALPGDRVGLIAFAGGAFVQAPLTVDHAAVVETLRQFDSELIPRGGTNLGSAVQLAIDTFKKADVGESALILFSDGEDLEGGEQLASLHAQAADSGMTIVAIAVGTEAGSIIPDPEANEPGVFVKDESGKIVRSRLNPVALQAISADTENGLYLALDSRRSIASVVAASLSQLESTKGEEVERERPIERFGWFLAIGLLLFTAGWVLPDFRRSHRAISNVKTQANRAPTYRAATPSSASQPTAAPASAAASSPLPSVEEIGGTKSGAGGVSILAVAVFGFAAFFAFPNSSLAQGPGIDSPSPAEVEDAKASEKPRDQELAAREALQAMQNGAFEKAANAYRAAIGDDQADPAGVSRPDPQLNFGLGSAAYKLGDYETAKQAFSRALESADPELATRAQYNLANTLFRHGETFLDANLAQPDKAAAAEQWTTALEHYQGALKLDPGNDRARHNADVVSARLELLKQEQQQQEEEQKKDEEKEQEDPPEDEDDDEEEEEEEDEKEEEDKDKEDDKEDKQNEDGDNQQNDKNGEGQDDKQNQDQDDKNNEDKSDDGGSNGNQDQNQGGDQNQDPGSDGGQQPPPDGGGDQGSDGDSGQQPPPEGGNDNSNEQKGDNDEGNSPPPSGDGSQSPPPAKPENGNGEQEKGDKPRGEERQPQSENSSTPPNSETEEPPDGELEANPPQQPGNNQPAQPQNANSGNAQAGNASQQQGERDPNADVMNAETGYTPSEARRLLRTQSEEALRMLRVRVPQSNDRYRNW